MDSSFADNRERVSPPNREIEFKSFRLVIALYSPPDKNLAAMQKRLTGQYWLTTNEQQEKTAFRTATAFGAIHL
jgi:hypothetical protein